MLKVNSNLKKLAKDLDRVEYAKRYAVADSLRNTSEYAKRESAKAIRDTGYSTTPLQVIRSKIYLHRKGNRNRPITEQSARTDVRGGDIPVMYMRPKNKAVRSRKGRRWGVTVSTGRLRENRKLLQGAFHLKSKGRRQLEGAYDQPFTRRSKLFTRDESGGLKQYHFRTFSEVIEDSGQVDAVVRKSEARLEKELQRQLNRQLRASVMGLGGWSS